MSAGINPEDRKLIPIPQPSSALALKGLLLASARLYKPIALPVREGNAGLSECAIAISPTELIKIKLVCLPRPCPQISRPIMPTTNNVKDIQNALATLAAS